MLNIRQMQYKIYVKCGTFIILNCLIILKLNNFYNIYVLNDLYIYSIHTRNSDIVLYVYVYVFLYIVFLLLFITVLMYYFT